PWMCCIPRLKIGSARRRRGHNTEPPVVEVGPDDRPQPFVFQAMLRLSLATRVTDANSTRLRPDCLARYKAWSAAWITSSTARIRALGSATPMLTVTEISVLGASSLGRAVRVVLLGAVARRARVRRSVLRRSWPRKSGSRKSEPRESGVWTA